MGNCLAPKFDSLTQTIIREPHGRVRIQLMSDLHLETSGYKFDFPVAAPMLALLGDIGNTVDDAMFRWLDVQLGRFELIFFVAGNHEAYRSNRSDSTGRLEKYCQRNERFIFLNGTRYDLSPTITILGCTLWSAIDPQHSSDVYMALNDFRQIADFQLSEYADEHKADLDWLRRSITDLREEEPHRFVVVFTHHTPTLKGTSDPRFDGSYLGSAFSTELTNETWWGPPLKIWAFGHTHWSCDFGVKGVRLVANQSGYFMDSAAGFQEDKTIEVG